jgi:hypothetical protein
VSRVGSRRDVGKFSFANRTGREWNSFPQELVELEKSRHFRNAITRYTYIHKESMRLVRGFQPQTQILFITYICNTGMFLCVCMVLFYYVCIHIMYVHKTVHTFDQHFIVDGDIG